MGGETGELLCPITRSILLAIFCEAGLLVGCSSGSGVWEFISETEGEKEREGGRAPEDEMISILHTCTLQMLMPVVHFTMLVDTLCNTCISTIFRCPFAHNHYHQCPC